MKTAPFETGERLKTPNILLYERSGTKYGKNMVVLAREGVFRNPVMFEHPGKPALPAFPISKKGG